PVGDVTGVVDMSQTGYQCEPASRLVGIESRNCSERAVSLAGVGLGQKFFGNSGRMVFTNGVTRTPGQHLVIYADAKPELGPLHAPFKLSATGDHLVLEGLTDRGARYLIDTLDFGAQTQDNALARLGCGGPWVQSVP